MSAKVGIRMPTGAPASAFLSKPAPVANLQEEATAHEPEALSPPTPTPARELPAPAPAPPLAAPARTAARPAERRVRFQVYLPAHLAKLVDAEVDRRKASGQRGRGKSDYTAIFRDLVARHLR